MYHETGISCTAGSQDVGKRKEYLLVVIYQAVPGSCPYLKLVWVLEARKSSSRQIFEWRQKLIGESRDHYHLNSVQCFLKFHVYVFGNWFLKLNPDTKIRFWVLITWLTWLTLIINLLRCDIIKLIYIKWFRYLETC